MLLQMGHQRSFSDRGPQGDRGRNWERNQDRRSLEQEQRGGWERNQGGFQGGPGNRDQGFPDRFHGQDFGNREDREQRRPEERGRQDNVNRQSQMDEHTSWQHQPGNIRDQWGERPSGLRDNSPAARPEDIPFKKPKVKRCYIDIRNIFV